MWPALALLAVASGLLEGRSVAADPGGKTVVIDIGDDEPIDIVAAPPPDVKFGSLMPDRYHFGTIVADGSDSTSPRAQDPQLPIAASQPEPDPIDVLLTKLIALGTLRAP